MHQSLSSHKNSQKGVTLLELLIVIAIIAVLAVAIILVLNPAETLKKSRDSQRISDLATLKTAIGIYATTVTSPDLDDIQSVCLPSAGATGQIAYSLGSAAVTCTAGPPAAGGDTGGTFSTTDWCYHALATAVAGVDGTGWIPVKLSNISQGSPISNLPLDPTNTVTTPATPTSADLVYRYACQNTGATGKPNIVFEVDTILESTAFTVDDDKRAKDGGDNPTYYEVGTSVKLIGTGTNF